MASLNIEKDSPEVTDDFLPAKTNFAKPIIKTAVRILRPDEFNSINSVAGELKEGNSVNLQTLLLTGLRYVEAQRLQNHPEWFDGKHFIFLPPEAILKSKRHQKERWVRLNPLGVSVLLKFFQSRRLPTTEAWRMDLVRWAKMATLNPIGLGPKTTRKTWESWLISSYPERSDQVILNQGHNKATALHHYLNMPFEDSDIQGMKQWTSGLF